MSGRRPAISDEVDAPPPVAERARALERLATTRLPSMQMADGLFCERIPAGGSPTGHSLRNTVVALIGLLRAEEHGIEHQHHLGSLRARVLSDLRSPETGAGDLGLILWAESRFEGSASEEIFGVLRDRLAGAGDLVAVPGRELAWIVIGLAETRERADLGTGAKLLSDARAELVGRLHPRGMLFRETGHGPARRFPTFETQSFGILALTRLARAGGDPDREALDAASAAGNRLVELQMRDGAWPNVYDAARGTVVEPYDLRSVHQDALAPLAMRGLTAATGDARYRDAALAGMEWLWGRNVLGADLIQFENGVFCEGIGRRDGMDRAVLQGRRALSYVRPVPPGRSTPKVEVDRDQRPEHLGWILEAWAGKEGLGS